MSTRRGFLGKLLGGIVASRLPAKAEVRGGKLVDDGTEVSAIQDLVASKVQRLVPAYPQNIGLISEGGNFPMPMLQPAFPVTLFNPTSRPVTESYHGVLVTVMPNSHARLTLRDQPIDDAHSQANVENHYRNAVRNLQPEDPEFYEDEDFGD